MIDKPWFKSKNNLLFSYPVLWEGWLFLVTWIALTVEVFQIIDKNSHSVSDTLIGFFLPFILLVILLILVFIATGKRYKVGYITLG